MQKTILTAAASLMFAVSGHAASDGIFGEWQRGDGLVRIRIATCGTDLCATNTWVRDPAGGEKVGERLVFNVQQKAGGWSGTAYDPQRKLTVTAKLTVSGDRLASSGCMVGGLICRNVNWTRVP